MITVTHIHTYTIASLVGRKIQLPEFAFVSSLCITVLQTTLVTSSRLVGLFPELQMIHSPDVLAD
jgi:hypothetical protein